MGFYTYSKRNQGSCKSLRVLYLAGPHAFDRERVQSMLNRSRYKSFFDYSMLYIERFSIDVDYLSPNSWGLLSLISQGLKVITVLKKYDIIITSTATGLLLAFLRFFVPWKKPYLFQIRWQIVASMKSSKSLFDKIWAQIIRMNVDNIICVSSIQIDLFSKALRISRKKVSYIPVGIDTDFFSDVHSESENNIILCIGDADRDDVTLVSAIKNLPVKLIRVSDRMEIIENFKRLLHYSQFSDLKNRFLFLSAINDNQLRKLYSEAKIVVVVISKDSSQPAGLTALLEAMAMGKPVIITEGFATNDYVLNGKTGIIIKPANPTELRNAIIKLLSNYELRRSIGNMARRQVEAKFNIETNAEKLAYILRKYEINH